MQKNKVYPRSLIAIPNLNLKDYCEKLIDTIKFGEDYYLLLIDNNSTDGSQGLFMHKQTNQNTLVMLNEENKGASGSWNQALCIGFEELKCDQVFILNNDTLLLPETLKIISDNLRIKKVGLASAKNISGEVIDENDFFTKKPHGLNLIRETPDFSCFGINKYCFNEIGYFDESFYPAYFEDNDYHYRMKLEGIKAICNYDNYYFHYGSRTKHHEKRFDDYIKWRYLQNQAYYSKKWGGEPGKEKYKKPFGGNPPEYVKIQKFEKYNNEVEKLNLL